MKNSPITRQTKILIKRSKNYLLDLILPKECLGCGLEGAWLCPDCRRQTISLKSFFCPKCQKLNQNGEFCHACRKDSNLAGIIIAAHYQKGALKEAIHVYKYEGIWGELENYLAKLLIKRLTNHLPSGKKVIIPIPLHYKKQMERGFNQAERLARIISRKFNLPLETKAIKRIKETDSQANLKKKDRLKNIKGAFKIKSAKNIKGRTILLLDDVATTGTTLNEAARVLKKNGARRVWGVVIAHD